MNLVCPACTAVNRLSESKLSDQPICGKCKHHLLSDQPVELSDDTFSKFIEKTELPIVVDFWAPWCGPCRMMAPAFADAARQLSPSFLLAKLDTAANPGAAGPYSITSIPTLILFKSGREVSRQSGALNAEQIVQFAKSC